jgi:tellurite resistance protein TehA-like permease
MKNPVVYYVVMAVGIVALALGVYWDLLKHDHPARGLILLIVGIVLLIVGIAGFFVMKPKAVTR